MWDVFLKKILK